MNFCPTKLKWLLLLAPLGAMVLSTDAQEAGQPIIFSAPQTADAQPAAPSSNNSQPGILPGTLQAPVSVFDFNSHSDPPLPSPAINSSQQQRMRQLLDDRKNWILMTPEEILGMPPAKSPAPERDAFGREKTETQLERYLERESHSHDGTAIDLKNARDGSRLNFSRDQADANLSDYKLGNSARNGSYFSNGQPNRNDFVSDWAAFNRPLPQAATKVDPEQVASMERFRQLLAPTPAPESSPDSQFFPAPKPVVNPLISRPDFVPNPAGASFTPLSSGIGKPTGLTPLPDAVTGLSLPVAAPTWKLQPAPWLLSGPQPFVTPHQKGF